MGAKKLLWIVEGLFALGSVLVFFPQTAAAVSDYSFLVKIKPGYNLEKILKTAGYSDFSISEPFGFSSDSGLRRVYSVRAARPGAPLGDLAFNGGVDYVQENKSVEASGIIASDPEFATSAGDADKQWYLNKIKAPQAWEISRGSKDVDVAVVDTGIDGKHEDLGDGRVGAGYLSYCQVQGAQAGQCLVHISSTVAGGENTDDNGHGTIIAGIIGAISDNARGIAGIAWNVRLMPVKVLDSSGSGVSSDVAAGIVWAVDNGADIVNLSLGGASLEGNPVLSDAIAYAYKKSVLVVAAAGNDSSLTGSDLDTKPVYPVCSDGSENMVLGVASVDMADKKTAFSNFGRNCIDLTAPGAAYFNSRDDQRGMVSTYYDPKQPTKNNLYVYAAGTSMSAAIVSGVAALLKSKTPDLNAVSLRSRLMSSAEKVDSINSDACQGSSCAGKLGSGRVDALRALQTTTFTANSLIRDSSGKIFFIEEGLKRPVSDFVFTQRGFVAGQINNVSLSESESLPKGEPLPPLDGTLLKSESDPTVYLVGGGILQPVSYLVFRSYGYDFARVISLPDAQVSLFRKGKDAVPKNGALIKLAGQPGVYFIQESRRRLVSAFVFKNRGFKFSDVVEADSATFESFPADGAVPLEPPTDGALVKGIGAAVYVFEGGLLRLLSAEAFAARSYKFSEVKVLSDSEIAQYPAGQPVL